MALFRIDYHQTEHRHCYIEAKSQEAAEAAFEQDGPSSDDRYDDAFDTEVDEVSYVCPKDGGDVGPGECCSVCGVLFDEVCAGCGQAGYHADACEMLAYLEARASEV